jgi:ABC transporter DrrB family efflux protein
MISLRRTLGVSARVMTQIRNDKRTLGLMMLVPSLLIGLLSWMLDSQKTFDHVGPSLVGLFPFTVMFLLTSVTTLRERRSGTLERFLTMPLRKGEFVLGYALAFGGLAVIQALITLSFAVYVCGLTITGETWQLIVVAICNALMGMSLGLMASAFANTEFQVVQLMPTFIFPQIMLGGVFVPRENLPNVLKAISDWLPLSHAIQALNDLTNGSSSADIQTEIWVLVAWVVGAISVGALTLKRKTT